MGLGWFATAIAARIAAERDRPKAKTMIASPESSNGLRMVMDAG